MLVVFVSLLLYIFCEGVGYLNITDKLKDLLPEGKSSINSALLKFINNFDRILSYLKATALLLPIGYVISYYSDLSTPMLVYLAGIIVYLVYDFVFNTFISKFSIYTKAIVFFIMSSLLIFASTRIDLPEGNCITTGNDNSYVIDSLQYKIDSIENVMSIDSVKQKALLNKLDSLYKDQDSNSHLYEDAKDILEDFIKNN
jgi:hypothetical protein